MGEHLVILLREVYFLSLSLTLSLSLSLSLSLFLLRTHAHTVFLSQRQFTPPYGTPTNLRIHSAVKTKDVIIMLLAKFKV